MRMKNSSGKSTPISLRECMEKDSKRVAAAVELDGESDGSWTEEVESPRSVTERGGGDGGGKNVIHSQILRIIAEDSHIGEDVGEGHHFSRIIVFSRPVSPNCQLKSVKEEISRCTGTVWAKFWWRAADASVQLGSIDSISWDNYSKK